jgi:iron complex transport system substrate-binding protein
MRHPIPQLLLWAILLSGATSVVAAEQAGRIVSINLCTDQLLLMLAAPERIASVTALAAEPDSSFMAAEAKGHKTNVGLAEEVLSLKPDLVLAGSHSNRATIKLLRKLGFRVEQIPMASDIAGIRDNVRRVAELLGEQERGEQIIQRMDARIAAVAKQFRSAEKKALFYQPRGYTSGSGTLQDEALRLAGWRNVAAESGIKGYGVIGMEQLLHAEPQQIFTSTYAPGTHSVAQRNLSHPALKRITGGRPSKEIGFRYWICGGPMVADAVELLARAHQP